MSARKAFKSANTQKTAHKPTPTGDTGIIGWRTNKGGGRYPLYASNANAPKKVPSAYELTKKDEAVIKAVSGFNHIEYFKDTLGEGDSWLKLQNVSWDKEKVYQEKSIMGDEAVREYVKRQHEWQKAREENAKEDAAWDKAHGFGPKKYKDD